MTTDWLIGSHPSLPACTFDVTVGATTESFSIVAGAYYLWDNDSSLDLLYEFQQAINGHSLLTPSDCSVFMGQDRYVQLTSAGSAFAVTFTGDTSARNMMGIAGNLVSATSHSAGNLSAFLWSPGKVGSPDAQMGTQGNRVKDTQQGAAGTGYVRSVQHGYYRTNRWEWRNVDQARTHTATEASGEYFSIWDTVLTQARRFNIVIDVDEDTTSQAEADLTGTSHGPYQSIHRMPITFDAPREQKFVHVRNRLAIKVHQVPEYT